MPLIAQPASRVPLEPVHQVRCQGAMLRTFHYRPSLSPQKIGPGKIKVGGQCHACNNYSKAFEREISKFSGLMFEPFAERIQLELLGKVGQSFLPMKAKSKMVEKHEKQNQKVLTPKCLQDPVHVSALHK